jgi:hypothetical protein
MVDETIISDSIEPSDSVMSFYSPNLPLPLVQLKNKLYAYVKTHDHFQTRSVALYETATDDYYRQMTLLRRIVTVLTCVEGSHGRGSKSEASRAAMDVTSEVDALALCGLE